MRRDRGSRFLPTVLLAVVPILLFGCAEPTLDGANLQESIQEVRESLDEERRPEFGLAVEAVRRASRGEIEGVEPFSVDAMTAEAVFAKAREIELRRELAWAQEAIDTERRIVEARSYLDRLAVQDLKTETDDDGDVVATFVLENGLGRTVDTAWLRIEAEGPRGKVLGGEEMVDLRPGLEPGERREVRIPVTSDAARVLPPTEDRVVTSRVTLVERGGDVIAQEPSPELLAEAQERLAEAERRRAELQGRLDTDE